MIIFSPIWFLDKLAITFLVLCVFAFEFSFIGIPLRYYIVTSLFVLSLSVCKKEFSNRRTLRFWFFVSGAYCILMAYSVIVKMNEPSNFFFFIKPFMVFLVVPAYSLLFRRFGVERYMNTFAYAMLGLIILYLYLLVRTAMDPGYGLALNDRSKLLVIAVYDFMPRVVFENFVFIVPLASYLMSKTKGVKMHICFALMMVIALLSMTLGLVLALVVVYLVALYWKRSWRSIIPLALVGCLCVYIYINSPFIQSVLDTKGDSADYKTAQLHNVNKDMEGLDFAFGRGLGCEFKDFDSRRITEPVIEIAGIQMYQSGGFFFIWLIIFPYLIPVIPYVLSRKVDKNSQVLALSQTSVFVASMANPYIWSGSVGLLFMMLFISYRSSKTKIA